MPTTVPCPICRRPVVWAAVSSTVPFCSARCRLIDLGRWSDGGYVVAGSELADDDVALPGSDRLDASA